MPNPKTDEAVTVALEAIHDAAPGLLTLTEAAEKVASHADVTVSTGRNRLRAAVEAGKLVELTPWSRRFIIELPVTEARQLGQFYIARDWLAGDGRRFRDVITTDDSKSRPSTYGPGRTTYLADPEWIDNYVMTLLKEKEAAKEAEREAARAEKKLQRKEITRRLPGLQRSLRAFELLSKTHHPGVGKKGFELVSTRAYLDNRREGEVAEERDVNVSISVYGNENAALLHAILEAGLTAYIAEQPLMACKHCERRILHTEDEGGSFWWHVETAKTWCKGAETKAEPVEEN